MSRFVQYEYRVIKVDPACSITGDDLTALGREGWRVISTVGAGGWLVWTLERSLPETLR